MYAHARTHTHATWLSDGSLVPEISMKCDDHPYQRNFNNYFRALTLRLTHGLFRFYPGFCVSICRYFGGGSGVGLTVKQTNKKQTNS